MPESAPLRSDGGSELTDLAHGVPAIAVSTTSTAVNLTGSWKNIRPVYRDQVAPCNQGCPIGVDIEGYMNLVRQDRVDEALDLLLRENPLPATTGRVCYHPCERSCNRAGFDEAVSIHAVERALGDRALDRPLPERAPRSRPETIAVVGSGPAGLSCAYHLARFGYGVTIYEADPEPGGILRYGIPGYRLPKDVLAREIDRICASGVELHCGVRIGSIETLEACHNAVFLATGAHRSRTLGIPGEALPGVQAGLEFLRRVNRGERPDLGRRVVVVGGGNTAMDCARTAVRLGSEVLVVYRRDRAQMPANPEEVEEAICEGVRFEFLTAPIEILGEVLEPRTLDGVETSFGETVEAPPEPVTRMRCLRTRLGEPDASGRRAPEPIPGSDLYVPADAVLTALGEDIEPDLLPERETTSVHVNPLGATRRALVYAGGDLLDAPRTVAYAIGSGKRAAIGIDHTLRILAGEGSEALKLAALRLGPKGNLSATRWRGDDPVRRTNPVPDVVASGELNTAHFERVPRHRDRFRPMERDGFRPTRLGLTPHDAWAEARRCLNCGVCNGCELCLIFCPDVAITRTDDGGFVIDETHCKGCGVCVAECPRGAMTMTREGL